MDNLSVKLSRAELKKSGAYEIFQCLHLISIDKKLLFFKSHGENGMEGAITVTD
jgi:hypothetical protein